MINIENLAHQLEFEIEDVHALLDMFIESAQTSLEDIKKSFTNQNITGIRDGAHAIKGSAGNLLLNEICLVAQRLERSAIEGKTMTLWGEYKELEDMIQQLNKVFGLHVHA